MSFRFYLLIPYLHLKGLETPTGINPDTQMLEISD